MKSALFLSLLIFASCSPKKTDGTQTTQADSARNTDSIAIRTIKASDLKTGPDYSTPVISGAQKFIIPVPDFKGKGEPLVYPKDNEKAGQPVLDYEGKPIGKQGIVFFNFKDQSLQAAPGDGKSVIIINEVTQEQAAKLHEEIAKINPNPNFLTLNELKQVIEFAHDKLSLSDMYNSTRSFIKEKMTSVGAKMENDEAYGLKKRDDRDVNQAIYIPGAFVFEGPAASPQKFENGGVIVEQGGKMRGVQPDIFMRTYKLANGTNFQSLETDLKSYKK